MRVATVVKQFMNQLGGYLKPRTSKHKSGHLVASKPTPKAAKSPLARSLCWKECNNCTRKDKKLIIPEGIKMQQIEYFSQQEKTLHCLMMENQHFLLPPSALYLLRYACKSTFQTKEKPITWGAQACLIYCVASTVSSGSNTSEFRRNLQPVFLSGNPFGSPKNHTL